jgi:hypothetical protein
MRGRHPLADLAAWERFPTALDRVEAPPFNSLLVTCNFFRVWGLDRPRLGRLFRDDECATPGAAPVALISEELWRGRFGADPEILGKPISVNRQALTVIGVAPGGWSGRLYRNTEIWMPYTMQPRFGFNTRLPGGGARDRFRQADSPWLEVAGRLHSARGGPPCRPCSTSSLRQDAPIRARSALLVTDGSVPATA